MKRRIALFVFLVSLLALTVVAAQEVPTFRIGILDDEQGALTNAARLAVQQINDAGGVQGADGTTFDLELIVRSPSASASLENAAASLREAEVIAVIGPVSSEAVINGLTTLQELGVPVLTPATDDTITTADETGRIFRIRAPEAVQGDALARYLADEFGLTSIATVQLDVESTASMIGFTTAISARGVTPQPALLLSEPDELTNVVAEALNADPQVVVAYGEPGLAAALYRDLRTGGFQGLYAYNQAHDPVFQAAIPFEQLTGILSVTTWSFTSVDTVSVAFLNANIRAFGEIPGPIEAAGYDAVLLIEAALAQPGELSDNIANLENIIGVQGLLNPVSLGRGETSTNVEITRLGEFGAPEVLVRYRDGELLPPDEPAPQLDVTPTPAPTATLEGVVITIRNERQNIRGGPGMNYTVLGQATSGQQFSPIGVSEDTTWVVIDFQGQQGWLATYLLDVFGELNTLPVIPAPPLVSATQPPVVVVTAPPGGVVPTVPPGVVPTPTVGVADVIIDSVQVLPQVIVPNQNFAVNVLVRNIGSGAAGAFTIAGTFPPNNTTLPAIVPGLPPGGSAVATINGILTNTGVYTTSLIIDSNNQVNEGQTGELNNIFNLTYRIDRPLRNQGQVTLNLGDTLDLEGDFVQGDVNWNSEGEGGLGLDAIFGARLAVLGTGDFNAAHYDQINPSVITRDRIPSGELIPGTLIGIITANGNRGIMQVNSVSDTQLILTFRVYSG
jgi:ABC-type branched-subunit amino acid transport system substrate-binding protein